MVDFGVPYAIDGSRIPAEGLRRQAQRNAGSGSGVARAGDLKITEMPTPDKGIRIAPGDDIIQCRAPNRDRESYGVPLFSAQDWMGDEGTGIPGTSSGSGRRDMIIHEILDPDLPRHYTPREKWPAGALSKLSIVPGVPASAKRVSDVPALNEVTCYELAAINWPAGQSTIINDYIEDLRRVHRPERVVQTFTLFPTGATGSGRGIPLEGYSSWPLVSAERPTVRVPDTATKVTIRCWMQGIYFVPGTGQTAAGIRTGFAGTNPSQHTIILEDANSSGGRHFYMVTGVHKVPAEVRGTDQLVNIQATRSGTGTGRWWADYQSTIDIEVTFEEAAI